MRKPGFHLPGNWPGYVRSATLHAASMAHAAVIHTRSWCANSPIVRVQLAGKLERAQNEIAVLREILRIKDTRGHCTGHHRPDLQTTGRNV